MSLPAGADGRPRGKSGQVSFAMLVARLATGSKKSAYRRPGRSPPSERLLPGAIICTCGRSVFAEPQVCGTAVMAITGPEA